MRRKNWRQDELRPAECYLIRKQDVLERQAKLLQATDSSINMLTFALALVDDHGQVRTERDIQKYSILGKGTVGNRKKELQRRLKVLS